MTKKALEDIEKSSLATLQSTNQKIQFELVARSINYLQNYIKFHETSMHKLQTALVEADQWRTFVETVPNDYIGSHFF